MTVPVGIERNDYPGTGVQTIFPYTFGIFASDELYVIDTNDTTGVITELAETTNYTVTGVGVLSGGTVVALVAPAIGHTISILSNVPYKQSTQLKNQGRYFPQTVERAFDRIVRMVKQINEILNRTIRVPTSESRLTPLTLPSIADRKGKFLVFDAVTGDPIAGNGSDGTLGALAAALLATTGATLVGWIQTGIGAVKRLINDKLNDTVHFKDYGVVSGAGGVAATNDAAIAACLAANPNRTIHATGRMNISATVFIDGVQRVVGEGGLKADEGVVGSTYFQKSATMNTVGVVVGFGAILDGVGVNCPNGSTNGGLQIRGNSGRARNMKITGAGKAVGATGIGCRIGDTAGTNTNSWRLYNVIVTSMTGDAFWVHDGLGDPGGPNCNAGKGTMCQALSNGGKGLVIDNATLNTFDTFLEEANDGWGVDVGSGAGIVVCSGNVIYYGDSEGNVAGQIRFGQFSNNSIIHSSGFAVVTDLGFFTKRYDRYNSAYRDFTPTLWGSTGATKTGTAVAIAGSVATWTSVAHGYANGQTVVIGLTVGAPNVNLMGAFVIFNVTANTFDVTIRTDQSITKPVNASGLTISLQACGTYSAQYGRYRLNGASVDFAFTLVSTSIANLTGVIGIILPWDTAVISGGVGPTTLQEVNDLGFYAGITHTGKLALPIAHDGGRVKFIQKNIGSGLAPAQLAAADIAAATTIITSGASYQFFKET